MIYVLIDMTGKPKWIRKYKVQPGTNEPLDPKRFISVKINFYHLFLFSYHNSRKEIVATKMGYFLDYFRLQFR